MSLDVIKYAIARISDTDPKLGFPVKAEELKKRVGETITPKGIGGERRSNCSATCWSRPAFRSTIRVIWLSFLRHQHGPR